ncbi:hypothetical protein HPB51_004197 [Rhipicephalus microplus]|uniref:ATP-dependent DNA helicase 2 subunit 1 n=1 Tax=Rhipicephalus microplus TaxID=6941 RepID=A0A9J6DTI1_RHIMP|nr:hypothetical protein HPB51_004197 [Rhipicephalus microplus]
MFEEVDGDTAFMQCIKAAKSTMLNKITSSPKDLVGIILFGTDKDSNPNRFKNVYVLQDLESPGAESVLKLEKLIADGPEKFKQKYGHGSVNMADVLWTCALMFSKSRAGQRRVLVLTNQDDPHKGSGDLDDKAVVKAKDLLQSGIELDLVHLKPPGDKKFRPQILYKDSAEALMPGDISKTQEYGGRKAHFDICEVKQIKAMAPPGLLLLGFKPLSYLEKQPHVRPSNFVYPDEGSVRGSTRLFAALLQSCLRHRVAPVCFWISRAAQAPKLVYLLAQEEERDPHGLQMVPPGFHVVQLPFSDDRRRLQSLQEGTKKATPGLIALAREMVEKLRFTYHPDNFENPELQGFWSCLEALALDRDDAEHPKDYTRPDHEKMKAKAGEEMDAFLEAAFPDGCTATTAGSRKRAQAGEGGPAKKARSENQGSDVDVREEAKRGKLASLTVSVLRDFCKQEGLRCPSKKAEIVDCIKKHLKL